ncbi:MAG: hypothetical protein M3R62_06890 [Acidobacteriota bacterium]|nr:hypothetical protein [Acidobacteriota bacterium]
MRRSLLTFLVSLAAARAFGQADPGATTALDRLGAVVKDGHLDVEADLRQGSVPAIPKYALEVQGSPRTKITADAANGAVTRLHFSVQNGKLVVRGKGLRPKVSIESLDFESPKGITGLKFRGLGIWRPIVAIFGGIARSAVRKMEFRTDVTSVLKGEILGAKRETPSAPPPGPPPAPTPSFMDLVDEVRLRDIKMTAFAGRPVAFAPFVAFHTASQPVSGEAMTLTIEKGTFRPGRDGAPSFVELSGHIDGEVENGEMEFEKNKCVIAKGRVRGGAFEVRSGEDGKIASAFSADDLFFELASGTFVVPGGMAVEIDQGSTFDVARVKVSSAGKFSGVAKLDLAGKTGRLSRKGATISATEIRLKTPGLTIVEGRATGPLELSFDYELAYPFVVKYPIEEIPVKKLMLDFRGPFATTLQLSEAGGDEGEVTGAYVFKAPWAPIEQAALAALEAKWKQDLAIKNVDFSIVPKKFRPCGLSCFTLELEITAEKKNGLKKLFSQVCAPVGMAELFVDKEARSFVLKDVRIETHCKGIAGWVVNFIAPLLAKTYGDLTLFQVPPGLPLSIESVRGGAEWIEIGGSIDWTAGEPKPEIPPAPQPVVVEPET